MAKFNMNGKKLLPSGVWCLICVVVLFGYLGFVMGVPNMLNTIMKTAHDLLLNTVFYLMSICVITGALGRVFVEFGLVALLQRAPSPDGSHLQSAGCDVAGSRHDLPFR